MAVISNDRDNFLVGTTIRLDQVPGNYIGLAASSPSFDVVNGSPVPTSILITATTYGQLYGTPTFSVVSGSSGISQQVLNGKAVATLEYTSLTAETAVIRASLPYLGTTYTADIAISGITAKPSTVTGFNNTISGTDIKLYWTPSIDADLAGYEVRTSDSGWGSNNGTLVYKGNSTFCLVSPGSTGVAQVWFIRAFDTTGYYSTASATTQYTAGIPSNVNSVSYEYADTSLTNATVTIQWEHANTPFGLREYKIEYTKLVGGTTTTLTDRTASTSHVFPADWIDDRIFTITTVDNRGVESTGIPVTINKKRPNSPQNFKASAIDSTIQLTWQLPTRTSLPISHIRLKRGSTWEAGTDIGIKAGEFTTIQELSKGEYVYWAACVDTDGYESIPVSVPISVQAPPDFVFTDSFTSTFSGTKVNAKIEGNSLIMLTNLTENWQTHFTSNAWSTPQAQVTAEYPIYMQPGMGTATYTEIFDYGRGAPLVISSSSITVNLAGQDVLGETGISVSISTSVDGVNYTTPVIGTSTFAINFRFIKVVVTATRQATIDANSYKGSVYKLNGLNVVLSTKLKTDSGLLTLGNNTDPGGSYINFNTEFIDVSSINVTAAGTSPRYCVYNFMDEIFTCNYTITSGTMEITVVSGSSSGSITDHGLYAGQKVRLSSSTGTVSSAVYEIVSRVSATKFTVQITAPNGSGTGTLFMYPNTMRVLVYDSAGVRQPTSGNTQVVSWTIRGT